MGNIRNSYHEIEKCSGLLESDILGGLVFATSEVFPPGDAESAAFILERSLKFGDTLNVL